MSQRMIPLKIADMAVAACNEEIAKLKAENARLQAEVERLRKAGDAMAKTIGENGVHDNGSFHDVADSIDRWRAAKEGKPSV